jgi:hypothetical protein
VPKGLWGDHTPSSAYLSPRRGPGPGSRPPRGSRRVPRAMPTRPPPARPSWRARREGWARAPRRVRGGRGGRRLQASAAARSAGRSAARRPRALWRAAGRQRSVRRGRCSARRGDVDARGAGARGARHRPRPGAGGRAARLASRDPRQQREAPNARRSEGCPAGWTLAPGMRCSRTRRGSCAGSSGRSRLLAGRRRARKVKRSVSLRRNTSADPTRTARRAECLAPANGGKGAAWGGPAASAHGPVPF